VRQWESETVREWEEGREKMCVWERESKNEEDWKGDKKKVRESESERESERERERVKERSGSTKSIQKGQSFYQFEVDSSLAIFCFQLSFAR